MNTRCGKGTSTFLKLRQFDRTRRENVAAIQFFPWSDSNRCVALRDAGAVMGKKGDDLLFATVAP